MTNNNAINGGPIHKMCAMAFALISLIAIPAVSQESEFDFDLLFRGGFVLDGTGIFDRDIGDEVAEGNTVLYDDGDSVEIQSGSDGLRFLLVSGKPIAEPIAWRGPIVMNTDEELMTAFEEYRKGTFIKK